MKLPTGKVPVEVLKEIVFKNLGVKRREVILGPSAGFDGAVIDLDDKSLIVSTDPITGAVERIGWLAVNVNANDVATFGVEPAFFASCILLPENADKRMLKTICSQIDLASKNLGMAIIGGHCEVTPDLTNPIVIGCAMGIANKGKYVTAGGAKPGDKLILTKSAGVEGTAILATERYDLLSKNGFPEKLLKSAQKFFGKISVVKEAVIAFKTNGVNAMHDPTEGGVLGGIHEMADASNLGVKVFEEKIPIAKETVEICRFFEIDPLQFISSGALLIASKNEFTEKIVEELKKNDVEASVIGEFLAPKKRRILVRKNGAVEALPRPESDHLWLALAKYR
ncbi:MAG: AIR synthase family protein [Candidatus Bathyarchaeota archaeon]|nr:AIR synthase family protein [Candidatus Bathyarchaeota archaeon]MDW8040540.1 AIR synthase family protein [Nitrososphaerota archaeon]